MLFSDPIFNPVNDELFGEQRWGGVGHSAGINRPVNNANRMLAHVSAFARAEPGNHDACLVGCFVE